MKCFFLVFLFTVFSCKQGKSERMDKSQNAVQKVIVIQPLGSFKEEQSQNVFVQIKTINPKVVLRSNITFPEGS